MKRGFTLVELLVVVAIIVVLLALLLPALDKAVYQTELATCSARIKGVITAAQVYATGSNRLYPSRKRPGSQPPRVFLTDATGDDRPLLKTFMPYNKMLQCPLVSKVVDMESTAATSQVYGSYSLYFGSPFPGAKGMRKLGDRWTWNDDFYDGSTSNPKAYVLDTLVGDMDIIYNDKGGNTTLLAQNSHQDVDRLMVQLYVQGGDVYSAWRYSGNWKRGTVEMNHGREDGGVLRYDNVTYNDERMAKTPWDSGAFKTGHLMQVPK